MHPKILLLIATLLLMLLAYALKPKGVVSIPEDSPVVVEISQKEDIEEDAEEYPEELSPVVVHSADTISEHGTKVGNIGSVGHDLDMSTNKVIDSSIKTQTKDSIANNRSSKDSISISDVESGINIDKVQDLIQQSNAIVKANLRGYMQKSEEAFNSSIDDVFTMQDKADLARKKEYLDQMNRLHDFESTTQEGKAWLSNTSAELYKNQSDWDMKMKDNEEKTARETQLAKQKIKDLNNSLTVESMKLKDYARSKIQDVNKTLRNVASVLKSSIADESKTQNKKIDLIAKTSERSDKELDDRVDHVYVKLNKNIAHTKEIKTSVEVVKESVSTQVTALNDKISAVDERIKSTSDALDEKIDHTKELITTMDDKLVKVGELLDSKLAQANAEMQTQLQALLSSLQEYVKSEDVDTKLYSIGVGRVFYYSGACPSGSVALNGMSIYDSGLINIFQSDEAPNFKQYALDNNSTVLQLCIGCSNNECQ